MWCVGNKRSHCPLFLHLCFLMHSMAVSGLIFRSNLVGTGRAISILFGINGVGNKWSHLVGPPFPEFKAYIPLRGYLISKFVLHTPCIQCQMMDTSYLNMKLVTVPLWSAWKELSNDAQKLFFLLLVPFCQDQRLLHSMVFHDLGSKFNLQQNLNHLNAPFMLITVVQIPPSYPIPSPRYLAKYIQSTQHLT